jgi:hypothetical protein
VAAHQRFCCFRCQRAGTAARDRLLYASPSRRAGRRWWAARVATGLVRCARGGGCLRAELVDGVIVGGLIRPGEPWHLGHADGESAGAADTLAAWLRTREIVTGLSQPATREAANPHG